MQAEKMRRLFFFIIIIGKRYGLSEHVLALKPAILGILRIGIDNSAAKTAFELLGPLKAPHQHIIALHAAIAMGAFTICRIAVGRHKGAGLLFRHCQQWRRQPLQRFHLSCL